MRITLALAILVGLQAYPAWAAPKPGEMIAEWTRLNSLCRGGSGDNPATMKACGERDALTPRIEAAGWCYGQNGQSGYQYQWHACTARSLRSS